MEITPSVPSFAISSSIASRIANLFLVGMISGFYYASIKFSPFQSDSNSLDSFTINSVNEIQCSPLASYPVTPRTRLQQLYSLVSLQRYTKALSTLQRSSLVEKSRQKPQERMRVLSDALKLNNYDAEPLLKSCGISTNSNFTQVEGCVLPAPRLKVGNG